MNSDSKIRLSRDGDLGLLEINNPSQNYIERPEIIEFETVKKFVEEGIKALVVFGNGRYFSAGANLETIKEQIKKADFFTEQMEKGNQLLNYIDKLNIPVIAAISGVCFGAGLEIALACDIRICEQKTLFAFPEINHALFPGLGGTRRLVGLTGKSTALELTLNGDIVSAAKALELHIIDEVVEKKQALKQATDLAKKMTDNRPLAVIQAVMQSLSNSETMEMEEVIKNDAKTFAALVLKAWGTEEK